MIEEFVREMTAEERAWLRRGTEPSPAPRTMPSDNSRETWGFAVVWILTLVAIALFGGGNVGGFVAATVVGVLMLGYRLAADARRKTRVKARNQKFIDAHTARNSAELTRALADGRVTVKRVSAVAVIVIEPLEDEGTGYVFDLGDGRVLFLKGQEYVPTEDDDESWPNTDFELVRTVVHGRFMSLVCHGTALPPLRVVPSDEVDPQKGWSEREELLEMSMDEAVRTILPDR
jgi:hypothetical protein